MDIKAHELLNMWHGKLYFYSLWLISGSMISGKELMLRQCEVPCIECMGRGIFVEVTTLERSAIFILMVLKMSSGGIALSDP
jgi:hypothetical protein